MFNDHTSWLIKFFHAFKCRIGVCNIIVRQGFTLELISRSHARLFHIQINVEGRILMGVFAVTHGLFTHEIKV